MIIIAMIMNKKNLEKNLSIRKRKNYRFLVVTIVDKLNKILFPIATAAFFTNIWLLVWGNINNLYELQMLSIGNMMLLSFVLLRREEE